MNGFGLCLPGTVDQLNSLTLAKTWLQETPGELDEKSKGLQQFLRLKKESVDALRYRGEDVLKSLTKKAVREARSRDLKLEILNCSKLQVRLHGPHVPIIG